MATLRPASCRWLGRRRPCPRTQMAGDLVVYEFSSNITLERFFQGYTWNWQEIKAFEHPLMTSQALRFAFVSSRSALDEKPSRPHDGSSTCIHVVKLPCVQDPAFLPAKSDLDPPFVFEGLSR